MMQERCLCKTAILPIVEPDGICSAGSFDEKPMTQADMLQRTRGNLHEYCLVQQSRHPAR